MEIKPFLEGWGDVVGSIIGAIITFIALRITIKNENNKLFEQRKLENKPIFNISKYNKKLRETHKNGFVTKLDFEDNIINVERKFDVLSFGRIYTLGSGQKNTPYKLIQVPLKNIGNGISLDITIYLEKMNNSKEYKDKLYYYDFNDEFFSNIQHGKFVYKKNSKEIDERLSLFHKKYLGIEEEEVFTLDIYNSNKFFGEYVIIIQYNDVFGNKFEQKIILGKIDEKIDISPISKVFEKE